jgi:lipid-A-disaccharide synthase
MNARSDALVDILILSNGPGEVMTWVRPVVKALRHLLSDAAIRISVVLSPCPHASGREVALVQSFAEVDRVQAPEGFWPFLLLGKTQDQWDWARRGMVVFLGGDQFYAVAIGKRLGYGLVTYAEWSVRWLPWIDRCGLAQADLLSQIPMRFRSKVSLVGDLIAEAQQVDPNAIPIRETLKLSEERELVAILPGSKATKLKLGVPLGLAIADYFHQHRPQVQCIFPVAPTLALSELEQYAHPETNAYFAAVGGRQATLVNSHPEMPYLVTEQGSHIVLWQESPAYSLLSQCRLCLTTVGANTAELTALAAPMMVLIPTQILDIMKAWDGLPGLLANAPGVGNLFTRFFNAWVLKQGLGFKAWPNIWAGREVVPELLGHLDAEAVGSAAIALLQNPEHLDRMRQDLTKLRGQPGAALRFAELVKSALLHEPSEE